MHVATAVIAELANQDIDTVFGLPGIGTLELNKVIREHSDIQFITARHETAVSHQAWGYAQSSGRLAATLTISGPGDMNAMNGLKNALNDCAPLIHLTAENDSTVRGGDGIHEAPSETYDNVVKHNKLVTTAQATVAELRRAIAIARTPPKGPVRVGIPKNFLTADVELTTTGAYSEKTFDETPEGVSEAAVELSNADSVVIVAGGGIRAADAQEQLQSVAEKLNALVVTSRKGKGAISEDHELSAGVVGKAIPQLRRYIAEADIALCVGTDLDAHTFDNWTIPLPEKLIHVAMHPEHIGRGYEPAFGFVGDAQAILERMDAELDSADRIQSSGGATAGRSVRAELSNRLADLADISDPPLSSVSALTTLREVLPRDAIVSTDVGGFRTWSFLPGVFDVYHPRQQILPGSWGTMGTGLPAAIGAQAANPDADVIALVGDGGLLMQAHELHTAATEELPVVVIVLNNNDYAIISKGARQRDIKNRGYEWTDTPIDFASLAQSLGLYSVRSETPDEIRESVATALDTDRPTLLEIPIDPADPQVNWWLDQ